MYIFIPSTSINWSARYWVWVSSKTHWMSSTRGSPGLPTNCRAASQSASTCRPVKSNWPNTRFVVTLMQYSMSSKSFYWQHFRLKDKKNIHLILGSKFYVFLIFSLFKVLRNDVMSHVRTMESLNQAGRALLEVGSGDSPHGLQSRLEQLNDSWEFVRCETERRQLELENRLSQVGRPSSSSLSYTCYQRDEVLM